MAARKRNDEMISFFFVSVLKVQCSRLCLSSLVARVSVYVKSISGRP